MKIGSLNAIPENAGTSRKGGGGSGEPSRRDDIHSTLSPGNESANPASRKTNLNRRIS
jgi:hypothetical protein